MTNRAFKTGTCREQNSFLPPRIEDYVERDILTRRAAEPAVLLILSVVMAIAGRVRASIAPSAQKSALFRLCASPTA
jgi:hypothetical protein